jgi:hypothetical protein
MAKDKEPKPRSVARAKGIHEQIDQLRKAQGVQPRSLRDVIHNRMEKLDKKKEK